MIYKCNDKFSVESISCENKVITGLVIKNQSNGKIVFKFGKQVNNVTPIQQEAAADKVTNFKLTSKQLANILTIGLKAGFKEADILKVIKHDYNKNAILELSKAEYDAICKRLEDKANKDK